MPVANKTTMLLYQATLVVMLLMDHLLHVLGLRMEDTSEYRNCLELPDGGLCMWLCAARPSLSHVVCSCVRVGVTSVLLADRWVGL